METCWLIPSLLFLIFISFFLLHLNLLKIKSTRQPARLPPGPRSLPIIGNLHQLVAKNSPPHCRMQDLARVHGPIMYLRLGEVPTVVVSSAEVSRQVFKTHDSNFVNRPKLLFGKELGYNYSDIGFAPYGHHWRMVRKVATMELFSTQRVTSFRAVREEESANFIKSIASEAAVSGCINLSDGLFGLLFDITTRIVFSKEGKDHAAFRTLAKEMAMAVSGFALADLYPSIKFLPEISGMKRKLKDIVQESNKLLEPIIYEHKVRNMDAKTEEDLLDVLLKFNDNNNDATEFSLTTNNIKGIILEIYFAGSDSSSTVVEWAMAELLKNPKLMEKAQAEVRQVYVGKGTVDETKLDELKFVKLIIKETLRLHPPAPLVGPRESIERCQVYGYDIPPRTRLLVNAWAIGRDSNYWVEPYKFNPQRFEGSSIDYKGNNFELIPFGAGRRMCPGMVLGVANVELPLAMLLYHFDWKLKGIEPQELDMDEVFGFPTKRKNELFALPTPYVGSSMINEASS